MPKATPKKTPAAKPASKPAVKKAPVKKVEKPAPKAVVLTAPVVKAKPALAATTPTGNYFYANGKRKTSVAGVRLYTGGKGGITVNERTFENYFPVSTDQDKILSPLRLASALHTFTISVQVHGGGVHSQAEAVRHGISKALLQHNVEVRGTLKHAGFLTRDSRVKERKKYGLKRARRAPQFSKR